MEASRFFPSAESADSHGMIAWGGRLNAEWLIDAYRHGIFPWPSSETQLSWWSPDPRPVIEFDRLHVSRRLARTCRSGKFQATCDRAFAQVMHGCATAPGRLFDTWITAGIRRSYEELHRLGIAHSVEVWQGQRLVGGVYGVAMGRIFSAESKFHLVSDASKVAVVLLVEHLRACGFDLLDIQQLTPHSESLGAGTIPRREFLRRLEAGLQAPAEFRDRLLVPEKYRPSGKAADD